MHTACSNLQIFNSCKMSEMNPIWVSTSSTVLCVGETRTDSDVSGIDSQVLTNCWGSVSPPAPHTHTHLWNPGCRDGQVGSPCIPQSIIIRQVRPCQCTSDRCVKVWTKWTHDARHSPMCKKSLISTGSTSSQSAICVYYHCIVCNIMTQCVPLFESSDAIIW